MKFYRWNNTWLCESPNLIKFTGFITTGKSGAESAQATALGPIIIVRHQSLITPILINHERIHGRQQLETLFVGLLVLTIIEDIYAYFKLSKTGLDRYLWRSSEQEAYRNQHNLKYLQNRPWFSLFRYLNDKKTINFVPNHKPNVTIT